MSQDKNSNWLGVFAVALSATVFCTTEFLPVGLLRYIGDGLDVSEGTAGLMVTAPGLLAAVAAPFVTVAIKNHDRRLVLLGLSFLLAISNLVSMIAPNFMVLIFGRILFGVGLGGFWAIGAGLGGRLVEESQVGRATSIIFAGVSLGMLIGGPAGALIGDVVGWRAAFGAALAISVLAFVAQICSLPKLEVQQRVRPSDLLGIAQTQQGRIGLAAMFLVLVAQFATYTYVTPFLAQISGFGGGAISSILLGYTAIGLAGNFAGGAGASRSIRKTFIATIVFLMLPMFLLPVVGTSQVGTLALLAIWGLSYGAMPVALQMWMAKAAPNVAEGGMALFVANFQISIAVGSFVGGVVVDQLGLLNAMYIGGTLSALSLLTVLTLGRVSAKIDVAEVA
ncbi:MFS transporter [Rhizobium lusitanum]|uniref:MFS transporter n=1 Tax=Rhizobium lusitanum TaxID=293958 RepID=A0A6L9UER3_9HYPH|nr:MFS transporter [Rhizobium lusitanum]NEI74154.1 MFS transporter [Rhizobium lusitanum]